MLDNLNSKQKKILIIIVIIAVLLLIYFTQNKLRAKDSEIDENILIENNSTSEKNTSSDESEEQIIVHITGAVKKPGIVKLSQGSRMEDAIESAGGLTEDADISNVNLAYVLDDGTKIKIPSNLDVEGEEGQEIITEENGENIIEEETSTGRVSSSQNININKATETELETLPGIGSELATRIIDYREQNGNFSSIEDIKKVSGIGDSKYEKIKDLISIK